MITRDKKPMLLRRPPVKRELIVGTLRSEIIHNIYNPGSRLPTRGGLRQRFDAGPVTVQAAMDQLVRDGFVVAHGRRGTFAAPHPPHLHHYGLTVIDPARDEVGPHRSPFWTALAEQGRVGPWHRPATRVTPYAQIYGGPAGRDYRRLVADAEAQRLAGLIVTSPWQMIPWVVNLPIPVVLFADVAPVYQQRAYPFHAVDLDMAAFRRRALGELAARSVRRVAFLTIDEEPDYFTTVKEMAGSLGMEVRPEWVQAINPRAGHWAEHAVRAVFNRPAGERPRALVIDDDTLLEPAAAGLAGAGVTAGVDVEIVAHANFPLKSPAPIACTRLGFPVRLALQTAMDVIDRMRRPEEAEGLPLVTKVSPVFESEFDAVAGRLAAG